jgi:hypothetical protein
VLINSKKKKEESNFFKRLYGFGFEFVSID